MRWLGYGPEHNEWVHEEELEDGAYELLKQYKTAHGYFDVVFRVMLICWDPYMFILGW